MGEAKACSRAFKQLRGRISSAYTAVEHAMIKRVAAALCTTKGMELFAMCGDEAILLLDTQSVTEADALALDALRIIRTAFVEVHADVANFFRVETFLVHDLGKPIYANGRAVMETTRRHLDSGCCEVFQVLKGIKKELTDEETTALSERLQILH